MRSRKLVDIAVPLSHRRWLAILNKPHDLEDDDFQPLAGFFESGSTGIRSSDERKIFASFSLRGDGVLGVGCWALRGEASSSRAAQHGL